jgi:small-conductance mechanosensitive channel
MGNGLLRKRVGKVEIVLIIIAFLVVYTFILVEIEIGTESYEVDEYRAVMEDFSGKKHYSNWLEDKTELERKIANYPTGEGHINLPSEKRTVTKTRFTISFLTLSREFTLYSIPNYIGANFWNIIKVIIVTCFSLIILLLREMPKKIKNNTYYGGFEQAIEKILPWSAVTFGIKLIFCLVFTACIFGIFVDLLNAIYKFLPYIFAAIAAFIVLSIIISIILRITENIDIGDMIEFENHIGKIRKMGFFYTYIRTPKNERVYIPNIFFSQKTMKKLSKKDIKKTKPYIARFRATLSYRIPFGIVNSLFSLAIRDTADDLENESRRGIIKRGMECIRGFKEDIEKNIEELEEDEKETKHEIESYQGKDKSKENKKKIEELKKKKTILAGRIEELKTQLGKSETYTPYVLIRELDNYTINYEFCVFTNHPFHLLKINHYVMKNLKKRFDEFGVEIMSPLQISKREFNE